MRSGRTVLAFPGVVDHDDPVVVQSDHRLAAQQLKAPVVDPLGVPGTLGQEELQPLHRPRSRTDDRLRSGSQVIVLRVGA